MFQRRLPAEWEPQDATLIAFPSKQSDWTDYWDEIIPCYVGIIKVLSGYQPLIIVADAVEEVKAYLTGIDLSNMTFYEIPVNDTWARDFGAITLETAEGFYVCDFMFNGWGLKFAADKDNLITRHLWNTGLFNAAAYSIPDLVLEGGSIESDGKGTLLTTTNCLLSPNRNPHLNRQQIEEKLTALFGLKRVLWLEHGHLEGDDTDAHIDTLARLCDENTIAYVQCTDVNEIHYEPLKMMEEELKQFRTAQGLPYQLIPLPMCSPVFAPDDGRRLPATYANFLIMNDVVMMPAYNLPEDELALHQLQKAFPGKKVKGVDCSALLLQHGSLHCITMQFPKGSLNLRNHK
jgi:agmatine deiminase